VVDHWNQSSGTNYCTWACLEKITCRGDIRRCCDVR